MRITEPLLAAQTEQDRVKRLNGRGDPDHQDAARRSNYQGADDEAEGAATDEVADGGWQRNPGQPRPGAFQNAARAFRLR